MKIELHLAQGAALNAAQMIGSASWAVGLSSDNCNSMQREYIVEARKYLMDALDRLSAYQATLPEKKLEAA